MTVGGDLLQALCALEPESWALLERYAMILRRRDPEIRNLLKSQLHVLEDARTRQSDLDLRRPIRRRVFRRENGTIEITIME